MRNNFFSKIRKNLFFKKPMSYLLALVFVICSFSPVSAAMVSQHYVIHENVNHTFAGPVISGINAVVSGRTATVSWSTDVAADSFVVYSLSPLLLTTNEQGSSAIKVTSHNVNVVGLEYASVYYYQVKSQSVNGGISRSAIGSFVTEAAPAVPPEPVTPASGGGGILIIDKTDKKPPEITAIVISGITANEAVISWITDEPATSFVEYGLKPEYGDIAGEWSSSTAHSVILKNLQSANNYHLRILSSDSWGNIGYSSDQILTTLTIAGETPKQEEIGLPLPEKDINQDPKTLEEASKRALEILNKLAGQVSLNVLEPTLSNHFESIKKLTSLIPAPILSGEPRVDLTADRATISWTTDKPASSLVALSPENQYRAGASEPYLEIIGDAENLVTQHIVRVFNLAPDTTYHYQVRSKAAIGAMAVSKDYTFKTASENLQIISFFAEKIDDNQGVIKWVTNKEANSQVTFIPYHGNTLAVEEAKTIKDNNLAIIHNINIHEFKPGVFYSIEIKSTDVQGRSAQEKIDRFSTSETDTPPEISEIKTDSTIFVDRGKIQTIISWLTNEPATTKIYFMEGVQPADAQLKNFTDLSADYTKEHIVIIGTFKAGTVYSFRVESIDSGNNITLSNLYTFMTPKQRESIIDVIIRILENTFGWMKKIGV
jgi:hypothetical protein